MCKNTDPRILIIDNNHDFSSSLSFLLEDIGMDVSCTTSFEEICDLVKKKSPDIVLLSNDISDQNVMHTVRTLLQIDKNLKIILLSGDPSFREAVDSVKLGVFDYLDKFSTHPVLVKSIKAALNMNVEPEETESNKKESFDDRINFISICDHSLLVERLKSFSDNHDYLNHVNTFKTVDEMQTSSFQQKVDIALVCPICTMNHFKDIYHIIHSLYKRFAFVKPVFLNEDFSEDEKVELLKIGVKGFLSAAISSEQLERALKTINEGEIWTNRRVANLAVQSGYDYLIEKISHNNNQNPEDELTSRELEILKLLVLGFKNREIGDKLFISETTVKSHVSNIYKKFNVKSRSQAILTAKEKKLI